MIIEQESAQIGYGPAKRDPQGLLMTQLARDALAIVLAGGRGSRLGPLTDWRAKPAVPFGGKFRIIDFSLSNCVNSGVRRIGICTQYKAQSLIRHVQRGWSFLDGRFREFVELLPAQQRVTSDWYKGTADAVYQNLDILRRHAPEYVLILAGDHVYKMDYARMLAEHVGRSADVSIGCVEVPINIASEYGVMALDDESRVIDFEEKPAQPKPAPGHTEIALASMGIYVFNASFLYEQLIRDADEPRSAHDFGRNVIPYLIARGYRVFGHRFADSCVNMVEGRPYWRDVGTIDAYWEANLDLTHVTPDLNLYDDDWPIWSYQEQLPPAKFVFESPDRTGVALDSLVSGGCIVSGSSVPLHQRARAQLLQHRGLGGPAGHRGASQRHAQEVRRRPILCAPCGSRSRRRSGAGSPAFFCHRPRRHLGHARNARPGHASSALSKAPMAAPLRAKNGRRALRLPPWRKKSACRIHRC
jgi:glucose-1-phosphate adenylyltransferase